MAHSLYEQALAALRPDEAEKVEAALGRWSDKSKLSRIAQNIFDETALSIDRFTDLLKSFSDQLNSTLLRILVANSARAG
jgi:hypothetical protein